MRSRNVRIAIAVAVIAAATVTVLLLTRTSASGPYALTAWEYGAIAWVGPATEDLASVSATAQQLVDDVFALWGFPHPEAVEGRRLARKGDPAGGDPVDLRAIQWEGALLPPLIVVVFAEEEPMAEATGLEANLVTITYGVPPQPGFFDEDQTPTEAADWLADLTGASIAFACTAERWQERLAAATAGWMLDRALEIPEICDCTPYSLPELVRGGIGEFTVSRLLGGVDRIAAAKDYAAANGLPTVADENPLSFDVDAATHSALGASFIAYLVEEHGTDGLVEAICGWYSGGRSGYCMRSESRTLVYLKGWRAFLGLEPE